MYLRNRLTKDLKPEILKLASDSKAEGYSSGVDRKVSTVHFSAYE